MSDIEKSNSEPTMRDLCNLIKECATKNCIDVLKTQMVTHTEETASKITKITERVDHIDSCSTQNAERIDQLEASIEILKQDQLRNNICISGIPSDTIDNIGTTDIVIAIAKTLGVEFARNNFTSYPVAGNKFIIVNMYNLRNKQSLLNKIRIKKSLMIEEVFKSTKSNSQVYLNDHLTPYFNRLFLIARKAKKDGLLASATSYGGKIRARKSIDEPPTVITTEKQLQALINTQDDNLNSSIRNVSTMEINSSTSNESNTATPNKQQQKKKYKKKSPKDLRNKYPTKATQSQRPTGRGTYKRRAKEQYDVNRDIEQKKPRASSA